MIVLLDLGRCVCFCLFVLQFVCVTVCLCYPLFVLWFVYAQRSIPLCTIA